MRINIDCYTRQVRDHWLNAQAAEPGVDFQVAALELSISLMNELRVLGCEVELLCTEDSDQPYDHVEELRADFSNGVIKYRSSGHPLGAPYDVFRALHDVLHHCNKNYCFGLPGEMASGQHTLDLVFSGNYLVGTKVKAAVDLVMSDVVAPNAAYYADGQAWGDYDYTKLVSWPPHLVSQTIEIGKYYAAKQQPRQ